jgi:signal transduction histidine kinase
MTAATAGRVPWLRTVLAVSIGGVALAVYTSFIMRHAVPHFPAFDRWQGFFAVCSFVTSGVIAHRRNPDSRTGALMVAAGLGHIIAQLQAAPSESVRYMAIWLGGVPHLLLAHLVLTYPTGRFSWWLDRWAVAAGYVLVFGLGFLFNVPAAGAEMLWAGVAITIAFALLALRRWAVASRARRRVLRPLLFAALVLALLATNNAIIAAIVTLQADIQADLPGRAVAAQALGVATPLVPIALVVGYASTRRRRGDVGALVMELGEIAEAGHLRDALARVLKDDTLMLGYWVAEREEYVDALGRPIQLNSEAAERARTMIDFEGEPAAVIVHDAALTEEQELVDAAIAAARLAIVNERLQAEVRAQLAQVEASRARIVEAGDAERRRLERDLHDGAQQRLVSLNLGMRMLNSRARSAGDEELAAEVGRMADELKRAIEELRDLAHGIHPAVLTEQGLGVAVEALAEVAPVPTHVLSVPQGRLPPSVEATAYFTISEALANAGKHAKATTIYIAIDAHSGRLVVEVSDNGKGGADIAAGTGLAGIDDRVAAIGGTLRLESPAGGGTRLRVDLPCG